VIIAGSVSDEQAKEIFGKWDAPRPYIRIVPQPQARLSPRAARAGRSHAPPAQHGGADRVLPSDEDQPPLRARDRRVEQLAREDPRGRVAQHDRGDVELRALALVDRHRVDGLHRRQSRGRQRDQFAVTLKRSGQPLRAARHDHDHTRVPVVERSS